jgi:ABC-type transport system involved in multi-copper enzyme maturation permease subunit
MIDSADSVRPPLFDLLVFTMTFLSAVLSYVQLFSSTVSLALSVLSPSLLAAALYLALRGSAGISHLISDRIMELYMSYPISRGGISVAIYASRVAIPSILLISLPALASGIILLPLIESDISGYLAMYGAFLLQAIFYGTVFIAMSLHTRSTGASSILSLLFYFTYNIISLILSSIASDVNSLLFRLSRAMSFYLTVSAELESNVAPPHLWEILLVPALTAITFAWYLAYFIRRFEP